MAMKTILLRFWLIFHLAEEPDEIDIFGGVCTLVALPINLAAWLSNMTTLNAILSLIISLLSVAWLTMRVYREWGPTKEYHHKQRLLDDEEQP
jgi:membrane protein implicated in regulation of membrane protease activity